MNPSGIDDGKKRMMVAIGAGMLGLLILLAVLAEEEDENNSLSHPAAMFNNTLQPPGQGSGLPMQAGMGAVPTQSDSVQAPLGQSASENGKGKVWRKEYAEVHSARQAAAQALQQVSAQFKERVKPFGNAAVGDEQDQNFLMMFEGRDHGRPVRGVLRVSVLEGSAYVTAVWAEPGRDITALLAQSVPSEKRTAGSRPPPPIRWHNVPLPDGTGSVRLPEGWRITSVNSPQQGALSAEGPQGGVDLGYAMQLLTPQAAAMAMMPLPDTAPVAAYSHPEQAVQDVFRLVARIGQHSGQPAMQWGRILKSEQAPATLGGQAAFVHYAWKKEQAGQWLPMESLAYVNMAPVSMESWMYYSSIVSAPAAKFRQSLPMLLEIWGSWRVSDKVHQSRLAKALQTQQEAFDIHQQSYQYQQQVSDRVWRAWSEVNRGQQAVLDTHRNEVRHVDLQWADQVVRKANELEGTERWIKVDPFQLDY